MFTTLDIQRRLKERGFDPGPLDGIPGRLTTAAIADFQRAGKLDLKWPGTLGPATLAALFGTADPADEPVLPVPWMELALRKRGLHEGRNHPEVAAFLKSDGHTLGDPRQLPWCGDFVETCIAVALPSEPLPANPYLARNWLAFGETVSPTFGAVGVFWRGARSGTSGHVGFLAGASGASFYVLGGNQSNAVSIAPVAKGRLLGARWPRSVPAPATPLPRMVGGRLSTNEA